VNDGGDTAAIDVRVRVLFVRAAVRRPAGVADAGVAVGRMRRHDRGEVVELALRAHHVERAVLLHGDAGRVVPAVLQAPQPAHQKRQRLTRTDVSHDPAHR
jgi:hypothetical protein